MRALSLFFLLIQISALSAQAQEVIVEATSLSEGRIEPSRSTSLVSSSDITTKNPQTVADILKSLPGVEVVRQGTAGQFTSVFIRGARSEDTLVLIDGIESNDVMSPSGGFDFSGLSPENIERIEVYHGPQSVRFGPGALGGVINIVTKDGSSSSGTNYVLETGSYKSNRVSLSNGGKKGKLSYAVAADALATEGYSAAAKRYGNHENDGAQIHSVSVKSVYTTENKIQFTGTLRQYETAADIDTFGGPGGDDPNNFVRSKHLLTGVTAARRFFDDSLKSNIGFYFAEMTRDGRNKPHPGDPTDSSDHFLSENVKIESNHEYWLGEYHTLRLGLQWREETGRSHSDFNGTATNFARKTQSVAGESLTYLFDNETWFYDVGARHDESSVLNTLFNSRASAGRFFNYRRTKSYVTYGTGYKVPSLYQLYSVYGDRTLREENSYTYELTLEQRFADSAFAAVTLFENRFRNLIDFNTTTNKYFNVKSATSRGAEVEIESKVSAEMKLKANYTYLDSADEATGRRLIRMPYNSYSLSADYANGNILAFVKYTFKGDRADIDPVTFRRVKSDSHDVVDVGGSYAFSKSFKANARVENIFARRYEEVAGYGTAGLAIFAGISGEL